MLSLPPLILVVEDDCMMGLLCARALERLGVQVLITDSARRAAQEAERHAHRIQLFLVDVVLAAPPLRLEDIEAHPEADGARLLSLLKHFCPHAVAVQMSAYAAHELSQHGYQLEAGHFIQKPFAPATLRTFVQQLLPDLKVPEHPILPASDVTWY
jgi:two-component system, cell cycle sensor histidine kinase and response regulator CckA